MGRAKQGMIEAEGRGWHGPDGYVCPDCIEDEFLKSIITDNACHNACDYCGEASDVDFAAPVETLMEAIGATVFYHYNDPTCAGVPYDGGCFIFDPTHTDDVLIELGLECNSALFRDISESFVNCGWVQAAHGHWASSHENEILSASWNNFVNVVKHDVRYFFSHTPNLSDLQEYNPPQLLSIINHLANELNVVSTLPVGTSFYRVREREEGANWELSQEQMGPPPADRAAAGRMNPAGISYLYLAFEQQTALAEVLERPPCGAAIAQFDAQRALIILDLTSLPPLPSIFDDSCRDQREGLLFLSRFVVEISKPVRKDGREHVEYVPSQVVSEYFALSFQFNGHPLDGIAYPSAVCPGGKNLVLFPSKRGFERKFDHVVFRSVQDRKFANWRDLADVITFP
jgi:RES domain-containing protein